MSIDSSLGTPNKVHEDTVVHQSTLRHLRVCDRRESSIFHPTEYRYIAEYLDAIFPNLESLGVYKDSRGEGGYHEAHWDHIDYLRRNRQLIRALSK
jgi:hypothetical protein